MPLPALPPTLPLEKWERTKQTQVLWVQIVGKRAEGPALVVARCGAAGYATHRDVSPLTRFVLGAARRGSEHTTPLQLAVAQFASVGGGVA